MAIVDSASGAVCRERPVWGGSWARRTRRAPEGRTFSERDSPGAPGGRSQIRAGAGVGIAHEVRKEKRYLHRDGHEVWARLSMVPLPSLAGTPVQAHGHRGGHYRGPAARGGTAGQ